MCGPGDMMRERERERCCDTWTQLGQQHSTPAVLYCTEHPLKMKKVTRMMTDILRCDLGLGIRGMMDGVRDWSD